MLSPIIKLFNDESIAVYNFIYIFMCGISMLVCHGLCIPGNQGYVIHIFELRVAHSSSVEPRLQ